MEKTNSFKEDLNEIELNISSYQTFRDLKEEQLLKEARKNKFSKNLYLKIQEENKRKKEMGVVQKMKIFFP